ncbi:MAG TPA: hypothetical protein VH834_22325 [Solirubrobacteraceae bacterium]
MRISYANVVASLALFVALGGTAAAVTSLPRDSVGSPQIRRDAVRSPEIAKDAVRSPEIALDAVRAPELADGAVHSAEISDGTIRLGDISTGAQNALQGAQGPAGVAEVRIASGGQANVPQCTDQNLTNCPNLLTRTLGAGNWLVQAKLDVSNINNKAIFLDHCGLEQGSQELDRADFQLEALGDHADIETIALTGVLTDVTNGTTVAVRCSEEPGEDLFTPHTKITAMKLTTVIGP